MKKRIFVFLVLLCTVLVHGVFAMSAPAETGFGRVKKGQTNFRKEMGGDIICKLGEDEAVFIIGQETDRSGVLWYRARALYRQQNREGYIRADMVEPPGVLLSGVREISASHYHLLCLMEDGRVLAVGSDQNNALDVSRWQYVQGVAAGRSVSMALLRDGSTAMAYNPERDFNPAWTNVAQIISGNCAVGALHADGTVSLYFEVYNSPDEIVKAREVALSLGVVESLSVSSGVAAGLRADGTVAYGSVYEMRYDQDVSAWRDIVEVSIGGDFVAGVKSDGTVAIAQDTRAQHRDVSGWTDIVQLSSAWYLAGLRADGTVLVTDETIDVSGLTGIVQIVAAEHVLYALDSEGYVHTCGDYNFWELYGGGSGVVLSK